MKKISFIILVLFISGAKAQVTYNGPEQGSVASGIIVKTSDFNNHESPTSQGFNIINHFEPEVPQMYINPGNKKIKRKEFFYLSDKDGTADSVIVFQNFKGIPQTSSFPPDPYIAAGPHHLVQVVNRRFRITDKEGNTFKEILAQDWFAGLVPNTHPFDPKVIYDHYNNRWVMVWLSYSTNDNTAYYLISVSDDEDPLGVWFNWALPANVNGNINSNTWADYEGVGFDRNGIYLTSSQFSFSGYYQYDKIRIINNSSLYENTQPGIVTWTDLWGFTYPHNSNNMYSIRPVRMQAAAGKYYFIHVPPNGANFITVLELSDPVGNPVLTGSNIIFDFYYVPPEALQRGGPESIDGGGCALRNEPIYQNGFIHLIHAIKNSLDGSLSSLQYLCIDPVSNDLIENLEMGDDAHFYFYPSLAVDKDENSIFTFSRSSADEFAGAFFTVMPGSSSVPLSTQSLQEGLNYYYRDNGGGRNRWGDYSGAWIDPSDSSSFWIMTEYVEAFNTWGTKVGGVLYGQQVPVELVSFNYRLDNKDVILNWKTATEINNRGFQIERKSSADQNYGSSGWAQIGFVEGNGTATEEHDYTFTDHNIPAGRYYYRLRQSDFDGSYVFSNLLNVNVSLTPEFSLEQNYPNPFNPSTIISYSLPSDAFVTLKVYNVMGQEVRTLVNDKRSAGIYHLNFDASNIAAGLYIYRLNAGGFVTSKKMLLLK